MLALCSGDWTNAPAGTEWDGKMSGCGRQYERGLTLRGTGSSYDFGFPSGMTSWVLGGGAKFLWLRLTFFPTILPVIAAAEIERGGGRRRRQRPAAGGVERSARPRRPERAPAAVQGGAEAAGAQRAAGVGARGPGRADDGHRRGVARGEEGGRRGAGSLRRRWRELTALEGVRDGGEEGGRRRRGRGRPAGEEETGQAQA
ncbi:hypothetical protein PVAP13_3KG206340 [Panicum virgatum]|uniref:Uncharacterized protein n=1 Tax=Panicum virgatum TaxID=38727 RepID=A0A8T0ULI4_PANVG|nr:hypothetical protein PVAP13_3KG206340 [Panicum virgatum]